MALNTMRIRSTLALLLLVSLNTRTSAQSEGDAIQLNDGRFVFGPKMTRTAQGITIHFDSAEVVVPASMIKEATCSVNEGGASTELSAEAKAKLEKGLVLYDGQWMKKERREGLLEKRRIAREKAIATAREHQLWRNRYTKKTKYFAYEYTIDPDRMEEFVTLMETYYKYFTKEWKITRPSQLGPLKVCFYHDPEYYYQVSGAPRGAIGYFKFTPIGDEELNFYYDRLDERLTIDVMFHETNHYLTHLIDPRFHYPSWVNESLAEYYGASEWDPKKKKMDVGLIQEGRLTVVKDAILSESYQGLEDLINIPHGSFNAIHYAWGWTFVHFLMETPKYEKGFKKFYLALARDPTIKKIPFNIGNMITVEADEQIRALKQFLKVSDLKELEKEWHAYIDKLDQVTARGYSEAGKLVLARGMPIKATRYFTTALEKGADDPMTYYGLAQAHRSKRRYTESLDCLDKAIARDPLNGVFYVRKAEVLRMQNNYSWNEDIEKLCKLAVEIEPDNIGVLREVDLLRAFDRDGIRGGVGGDGGSH